MSEQLKYLGVWLGIGVFCALVWVFVVLGVEAVLS
jgi:hypothetical protein